MKENILLYLTNVQTPPIQNYILKNAFDTAEVLKTFEI